MPIDMKQFEKEGEEVTGEKKAARKEQVLELLKEHKSQAYTQREVADALEINPTQARSILMGLVEDGHVDRKQVDNGKKVLIYYAFTE